jgi:hypothetical protein
MGDYHAVAPVDWGALMGRVLPAWCEVLDGRTPLREFAQEFAPGEMVWHDQDWPPPAPATLDLEASREFRAGRSEAFDVTWARWRRRSGDYLRDIGWLRPGQILDANALHGSQEHQLMEELGAADLGVWFLMDAIRRHASVELAGDDPPGLDTHHGFYSRFHPESGSRPSAPCVKVAGTKNAYRFLEAVFEAIWEEEEHSYRCEPRPGAPDSCVERLASLFLSVRAFPGSHPLVRPMRWPAWSDSALVGYLIPGEVRELAGQLPGLGDTSAAQVDSLFPLFADRVRRSAAAGLGLVTFYSGL